MEHARIDHSRAVKKYHRPAAGNEAPLPEDIRPTSVLRNTMDYLLQLLDNSNAGFSDLHKFIRDRTRSIRQDITLQQRVIHKDPLALLTVVRLHEEMARFHILSGHRLCEEGFASFDPFQNTEQLRKVLTSLQEYYSDIRSMIAQGKSGEHAFREALEREGEFRAYQLLTHAEDRDVFRQSLNFAPDVFSSPEVQLALGCVSAYHQGDYSRYFSCVKRATYLQACLMQTHFPKLRRAALKMMHKAFHPKEPLPVELVAKWLFFENFDELLEVVKNEGSFKISESGSHLEWTNEAPLDGNAEKNNIQEVVVTEARHRRSNLVEAKVAGLLPSVIVRGLATEKPVEPTIFQSIEIPKKIQQLKPLLNKPTIGETDVKLLTDEFLKWVILKELLIIVTPIIESENARRKDLKQRIIAKIQSDLFDASLRTIVKDLVIKVVDAEKRRKVAGAYRIAIIDQISEKLGQKLLREIIRAEVRQTCKSVLRKKDTYTVEAILDTCTSSHFSIAESMSFQSRSPSKLKRDIQTMDILDHFVISEQLKIKLSKLARSASQERLETQKLEDLIQQAQIALPHTKHSIN